MNYIWNGVDAPVKWFVPYPGLDVGLNHWLEPMSFQDGIAQYRDTGERQKRGRETYALLERISHVDSR